MTSTVLHKLGKQKINFFILFSLFLLLFTFFLFHQNRKVIIINAKQLHIDFRQNATTANTKYTNYPLEVNGILNQIEKSKANAMKILLNTNESSYFIDCEMNKNQNHLINELIPGMEITVLGDCRWDNEKVHLKNCRLIKP